MGKCLVIGLEPVTYIAHEMQCRDSFLLHAPSGWGCDIAEVHQYLTGYTEVIYWGSSFQDVVNYAISNSYDIISFSWAPNTSQLQEFKTAWDAGIVCVSAHHSNFYEDAALTGGLRKTIDYDIAVGGGITENIRSYGDGIEFYDSVDDIDTSESQAVPTIAGKIAQLLYAGFTPHQARQALRQCCYKYPVWDRYNGYGRPDITDALKLNPRELDLPTPLHITINKRGIQYVDFTFSTWMESSGTIVRADGSLLWDTGYVEITGYTYENDNVLGFNGDIEFSVQQYSSVDSQIPKYAKKQIALVTYPLVKGTGFMFS